MLAKITIGLYVTKFSGNFSILTLLDLPEQLASLTNPPSWNTPTYLAAPSVFLLSPPPPVYLSMLNFHRDWFCTLISRWAHLDLPFPTDLFAEDTLHAKQKQKQNKSKAHQNCRKTKDKTQGATVEGKVEEQVPANWEQERKARRVWWPGSQRERKLREGTSVSS